jgi:hypothetical protein
MCGLRRPPGAPPASLGTLGTMVAFVQVPYQDMQVQNYQGGFVRPGGQWFREPILV